DRVASAQIEFAYLRWADVDVVGPRQIVVFGRAQETKAVGQGFQDTFGEDQAALFGLRREHFKDQLLFAHARRAGHVQVFSDLRQLGDGHIFQRPQVERFAGYRFEVLAVVHRIGQFDSGRGGGWALV